MAYVDEIRETMASMYKIFEADSEEVQREWVRYTQKVDKRMEEALRHAVKRSLQVRGLAAYVLVSVSSWVGRGIVLDICGIGPGSILR